MKTPYFVTYRVYADGTVVHEDDFAEYDAAQPYYDDYGTYMIPTTLVNHLLGVNQ